MTVGVFLADPGQLLAECPNGGAQIRDLAVANPAVLLPILSLLSNANKYQKFAIGNGLAQVAKLVLRTNQPYASDIQDAVARTKDQEVVLAYEGNTSDKDLGTIGTGQGGGGALGGGGSSGSSATGTNATSNSGNFTTTGGGVSSGGGTGSTTASGLSQASSP